MHRRAEYGIAAHWKYKEENGAGRTGPHPGARGPVRRHGWLRSCSTGSARPPTPASSSTPALRPQRAEVYVFTPKGDVIALPAGSTPVDFAYAVHTEVGHRCIGARVNGRLVPLESLLDNGDTVEIFTSKAEAPGRRATG
jgi:guanosine-3',5'-bis(diphosphate) 3'-pyrophosphohydrolase